MAEVTDHSGDQNTNSNTQDIKNFGVPPMVVYVISAFLLLLYLVTFSSQREAGKLVAEVQTLRDQVRQYETNLEVKRLMDERSLEDELRAEIANLTVQLKGEQL